MNTTTKIIGLVSIIAIILSVVAIGINLNTTNQTNQLNAQLNQQATQKIITNTSFDGFGNDKTIDFTFSIFVVNINSITVNGNGVSFTNMNGFDGTSGGINYNWVSGHIYTITINETDNNGITQTLTEKLTAPPTATPQPTPQILSATFGATGTAIGDYYITIQLSSGTYISSYTVNGVIHTCEYSDSQSQFHLCLNSPWISGESYSITVTVSVGIYAQQTPTYTATAP
ncbi:MAG: hypothetical protein ABSC20_01265 [Candidatus Bathyarchaeia archaeon]|jgi:hypothetical protein